MIASVGVCHAWADSSEDRRVLPDMQDELRQSLGECRQAFHRAMCKGAEKMAENPAIEHVPLFAHLTRRMSSFHSLFALADSLLAYLENHSWEKEEIKSTEDTFGCFNPRQLWYNWRSYWQMSWHWKDQDKLRLVSGNKKFGICKVHRIV